MKSVIDIPEEMDKKTYIVRYHVDTAIDIEVKASSIEEAKNLAKSELIKLDDYNKLMWVGQTYTNTKDADGNIID